MLYKKTICGSPRTIEVPKIRGNIINPVRGEEGYKILNLYTNSAVSEKYMYDVPDSF